MDDVWGDVERTIRGAIGGDPSSISWIEAHAETTAHPTVIAVAAVLQRDPDRIGRALGVATSSRDRQVVAIAEAHLRGNHQLVDALARDHLSEHPDSFIVAWIASEATSRTRGTDH
jgi:hypothetical protein